jgi:signal transduction histidine kinase
VLPAHAAVAAQIALTSAVAFPVRVGADMLAVVEFFSDQPHVETEALVDLMRDVSLQLGRVIERQRTLAQFSDLVWEEQQQLIHTLHDSLGQQLTGLGMMAASLRQHMADADPESAETAHQIARSAAEALERVRTLSKELFPADVDGEGFAAALRQLAFTTESLHKVACTVECEAPVVVPVGHAPTQLYRIAQEAITNVLRHANATSITIRLGSEAGHTSLSVIDNGIGIDRHARSEVGVGLRIMQHRAASIGATFLVAPARERGTMVKCTLRANPSLSGRRVANKRSALAGK